MLEVCYSCTCMGLFMPCNYLHIIAIGHFDVAGRNLSELLQNCWPLNIFIETFSILLSLCEQLKKNKNTVIVVHLL